MVGDAGALITFTHLKDLAHSIIRLSVLAVDDPTSVGSVVRISGDAISPKEIAKLVGDAIGKRIEITTISLDDFGEPDSTSYVSAIRYFL